MLELLPANRLNQLTESNSEQQYLRNHGDLMVQ